MTLIPEQSGEFFGDSLEIADFRLDLVQEFRQVFAHRGVCPPEVEVHLTGSPLAVLFTATCYWLLRPMRFNFAVLCEPPFFTCVRVIQGDHCSQRLHFVDFMFELPQSCTIALQFLPNFQLPK